MTLTAQAPCRAGDRRPKLLTKRTRREGLRLTVTAVAWPWAAGRAGAAHRHPDGRCRRCGDQSLASHVQSAARTVGLAAKWLEVLKEIAPQVQHAAQLFNPQTAPYVSEYYRGPFEAAAPAFGVRAIVAVVGEMSDIEAAMTALAREPGGGLVLPPDNFSYVHRKMIFALAARHRLPAVYPFRFMAREGGLVSYGVDLGETFPRAAEYINRILGGARPADLPVQAPTKFELVINLKTANQLGLSVSPTLLARADEVIE